MKIFELKVLAQLFVMLAAPLAAVSQAPTSDRSKPPPVEASASGFTVHRLGTPPTIDGKLWRPLQPMMRVKSVAAPNHQFVVSLSAPDGEGDVTRFRLTYTENGKGPVNLASTAVSYAFLAGNSRWVFFEPLEVVDLKTWRRYSLSSQFGISPYITPKAISEDGLHLIVARRNCAVDCQNMPTEYYEVGFP